MKKIFFGWILAAGLLVPSVSQAYIGIKGGLVDESNLGYGLGFGFSLPASLAVDFGLTGYFADGQNAGVEFTKYWTQGDVDLAYDFHPLFKARGYLRKPELHPYVKGGFTYAGYLVTTELDEGTKASHGPGLNFGGGVDWAIFPWFSIGADVTESFVFLNGLTIEGYTFPSETKKVFSAMATVKFLAY